MSPSQDILNGFSSTLGTITQWRSDEFICFLTQSASKELHSHSDVAIPTPYINSHVTSQERFEEAMTHYIVSLDIGLEQLQQDKK